MPAINTDELAPFFIRTFVENVFCREQHVSFAMKYLVKMEIILSLDVSRFCLFVCMQVLVGFEKFPMLKATVLQITGTSLSVSPKSIPCVVCLSLQLKT